MIKLYDGGVYLLHGTEIIADTPDAAEAVKSRVHVEVTKEEARRQTIAYGILKEHNTSGNMEQLQIRFDKLTSHDITFVGIIQTARASGLEKFPIPYVLTNCHNKEIRRGLCSASSGGHPSVCKGNALWRRKDDPGVRQPYPVWRAGNHGGRRGWSGTCETAS